MPIFLAPSKRFSRAKLALTCSFSSSRTESVCAHRRRTRAAAVSALGRRGAGESRAHAPPGVERKHAVLLLALRVPHHLPRGRAGVCARLRGAGGRGRRAHGAERRGVVPVRKLSTQKARTEAPLHREVEEHGGALSEQHRQRLRRHSGAMGRGQSPGVRLLRAQHTYARCASATAHCSNRKKAKKTAPSSQPKRCSGDFTSQKSPAPIASSHCQIANRAKEPEFWVPSELFFHKRRPRRALGMQ